MDARNFCKRLSTFLTLLLFFATANAQIVVSGDITANTTWTNTNVYVLSGFVYVKGGATLTIQPGTVIKGEKLTKGTLIVTRTGSIDANGTPEQPIVFTSNEAAGSRAAGDWGGVILLGNAPTNHKDGSGNTIDGVVEGGVDNASGDGKYGGPSPNPAHNIGTFRYVRIEYPGIAFQPNNEINGLTMGGVGSGSTIDHIQITQSGDDSYEWFGGTMSAKYLVAFRGLDDDFDTDNGWNGKVQFAVCQRDPAVADAIGDSNGFESDNDAGGTNNQPYTTPIFSNVTLAGPIATTGATISTYFKRGMRLRRNTHLNVFNSAIFGWPFGMRIESTNTQTVYGLDTARAFNNVFAGNIKNWESAFDSAYIVNPLTYNGTFTNNSDLMLGDPFNATAPNFLPQTGSPLLSGGNFTFSQLSDPFFTPTTYKGAFGENDWTKCWCEFNPQNEAYTGAINYAFTASVTAGGPTTFCQGGSVTLTANTAASGASYKWSTGATTQSISATAGGTYTVTVSNSRGCEQVVSQSVTVNANPSAPSITASSNSFCTGGSVTLTSSSATSYTWSNSGSTQAITVSNAGTYVVTIADANGCEAASSSVTVTENTPVVPGITAGGPTSFCTGGSVEVSVGNPSQFTMFMWSNGGMDSSITVTATGTYEVTTTDANGCTAASNIVTTSVSSSPSPTVAVSGALSFCEGGSVVLTSSTGDSYSWSNGATTQSITVTASGNYAVSVTNADPCNGTGWSDTTDVTVTPLPVAAFTADTTTNGYTFSFTNTTTGATTYLWSFGDGITVATQNATHEYDSTGTYTVTLIAANGNCVDTMEATVDAVVPIVNGIVMMSNNIESIRLFPNPTKNMATLEITLTERSEVSASICDITGRALSNFNQELGSGSNRISINASEFAAGIYFISIQTNTERQQLRMVVNR